MLIPRLPRFEPEVRAALERELSLDVSAAAAKEAALSLLRRIYDSGRKREVRTFREAIGTAKFLDVPEIEGRRFYQLVKQFAEQIGYAPHP